MGSGPLEPAVMTGDATTADEVHVMSPPVHAVRGPGCPPPPPRRAPSVLAVTSQLPWPLDSGGHLRTFHLLRSLAGGFRVRLVTAVPDRRHPGLEALRRHGIEVRAVPVGPRRRWPEAARAAEAALRGEPYVLYRRHDRGAVRDALRAELGRERPDLLYLDHLDSFVYRDVRPGLPCVLDLHNVYSRLTARAADEQASRWARLYLRREARLLARAEGRAARGASHLLVVSEDDGRYFAGRGARALSVVPNGVDCAAYRDLPTGRPGGRPTVLYVGAMSWGPNAAAAGFLARDVMPRVRARVPEARLRIVGRDPSPAVTALGALPGVEVVGPAPEILPHLRDARVLAVPLEAGGGTRLKILEAFAAGLPVVSTPVGCEGLGVTHGEHLLVSDRGHFAEGVLALLGDPALGEGVAARARAVARARFDWDAVGAAARAAVASLLGPGRGGARPPGGHER